MQDENFSYDPATEREVVRAHNARLSGPPVHYCPDCDCYPCVCKREEESQMELDRRVTGTYAEGADRLARILDALTSLATRRRDEPQA